MIKDLIAISNSLDEKGFKKEADFLDRIIRLAQDDIVGQPIYPEDEESSFDDFDDEFDDEFDDVSKSGDYDTFMYDRFMDQIMIRLVQNMYGDSLESLVFEKDIDKVIFDRLKELDEIRSKKGDAHIVNMYRELSKDDPDAEALINIVERLKESATEESSLVKPNEPIFASKLLNSLVKLSNHLDIIGYNKESDFLDSIIKKAKKKKKLTKKQLKALDLDGDDKITEKDFKLLGKRKKESKK